MNEAPHLRLPVMASPNPAVVEEVLASMPLPPVCLWLQYRRHTSKCFVTYSARHAVESTTRIPWKRASDWRAEKGE